MGEFGSKSLPMRGEWIEILRRLCLSGRVESLPMRGEWIEMVTETTFLSSRKVSPHAGRVD